MAGPYTEHRSCVTHPKQPMDRPGPQGQQQHNTSWFVDPLCEVIRGWRYGPCRLRVNDDGSVSRDWLCMTNALLSKYHYLLDLFIYLFIYMYLFTWVNYWSMSVWCLCCCCRCGGCTTSLSMWLRLSILWVPTSTSRLSHCIKTMQQQSTSASLL